MGRIPLNDTVLNVVDIPAAPGTRPGASGTPIVMIHGLAASSAFWYLSGGPLLSAIGPILLYDLRGHGKSDTPATGYGVATMTDDLHALLDAHGTERAHLVGHSFGGMIALLFALRWPERVASLTLIDTRVRPLQTSLTVPRVALDPGLRDRLSALGIDPDRLFHNDDGIEYLSNSARIQLGAPDDVDEILGALYNHPRLFRDPRNAERWIRLVETATLVSDLAEEKTFGPQELARLTVPLLILAGRNSPMVDSARALAKLCPHAVLRVIPNVGHFFAMSRPELFLRPTARFLRAANRGDPRLRARQGGGAPDHPSTPHPLAPRRTARRRPRARASAVLARRRGDDPEPAG